MHNDLRLNVKVLLTLRIKVELRVLTYLSLGTDLAPVLS